MLLKFCFGYLFDFEACILHRFQILMTADGIDLISNSIMHTEAIDDGSTRNDCPTRKHTHTHTTGCERLHMSITSHKSFDCEFEFNTHFKFKHH